MTCPRLNAPIVLAHGLFGFRRIGVGRLTLASYFRGIPGYLRAGGNQVVVTRVPPFAGLARRAQALAREIDLAIRGRPFHLIGHSMGGLDARLLLEMPGWSDRFLSLTTVGTPHLGSALADRARLRAAGVYRLLGALRVDCRGFLDVTRDAARLMHRTESAPGRVPCYCVAGCPDSEEVSWALKPFHQRLYDLEGLNDGLVGVESALGFGTPLPVWPVDHLHQMNWLPGRAGPSSTPGVFGLYASLIENLARHAPRAGEVGEVLGAGVPSREVALTR